MEAQLQGDNLSTMGKGKGRVSALFLNLKKEKTMDSYRKMNAFLTDADITTLLDILHALYIVEYVDINEDLQGVPMVRAESLARVSEGLTPVGRMSEDHGSRIQGIILRLNEALENKETIFE